MPYSLRNLLEGELLNAVKANDPIKVNELLTNVNDFEKLFALVEASEKGFLEIVQAVIQTGVDINQERPFLQGSALRQAAWEGHAQIVRVLLEAGADVILPPQNPKDSTALVLATQEGHFDVVKLLVEAGVNVNEVRAGGNYALLVAAREGYEDIFNYLALLTNVELHQEALNELPNGIKRRWREENANPLINEVTDNIWNDDFDAAIDILQVGLDISDFDGDGRTALFLAILKGSVSLVQFLIEAGANPDKGLEVEGKTPLMIVPMIRWTQESIIILSLLLDAGADTNARDLEEGWTVLMYFINSPTYSETEKVIRRQAVKLLLQHGVEVSAKDNLGRSALDLARDEHNEDLELVYLIENAR
ncbi:ankyrin repeat domain-containing protein [Phormidium nigroviride]